MIKKEDKKRLGELLDETIEILKSESPDMEKLKKIRDELLDIRKKMDDDINLDT